MINNNIGTLLYSFLKGKKIGQDKIGNKFYIHKKNKNKKWVLFKYKVDPTSLDVKWQIWLTTTNSKVPIAIEENNFKWQKEKQPNLTGTINSYHPKINTNKKKQDITKENKKSTWDPE